jgi:uncharacterized protein with GYD domain
MGKYLITGNYVGDGIAGLLNDGGTKRRAAAAAVAESFGGTLEAMYYAFGDTDIYALADMPDDASATAMSLTINASGKVSVTLTPLMTVEDVDAASQMSGSYAPPGT